MDFATLMTILSIMSSVGAAASPGQQGTKEAEESRRRWLESLFNPINMNRDISTAYRYAQASPGYQGGFRNLINNQQQLPAGPLGSGGVADTRSLLKGMSYAPALAALNSSTWNTAANQILSGRQAMAGAMGAVQPYQTTASQQQNMLSGFGSSFGQIATMFGGPKKQNAVPSSFSQDDMFALNEILRRMGY